MESTPLLRFVCATFAMRHQWEGKHTHVVGELDDAVMQSPMLVQLPLQRPIENVKAKEPMARRTMACTFPSPTYKQNVIDEDDDDVDDGGDEEEESEATRSFMPILEAVLAAQMANECDDTITRLVDDLSDAANSTGAIRDLVTVLITTLLSRDDEDASGFHSSVVKVLLLLSFRQHTTETSQVEFTPTPNCNTVLEQLDAACAELFQSMGQDALGTHHGVQWLVNAHSAIESHLVSQQHVDNDDDEDVQWEL